MGCGASKFEGEAGGNGRIQTFLGYRTEDVKRRRNVALRGPKTLSKNELSMGTSDGENSSKYDSLRQDDERTMSVSSQEENLKLAPVNKNVYESVVATPVFGSAKVAPAPEPAKQDDSEESQDSNEDNEYGRLTRVDDGCIYPGSPSFRVYYIESLANDENDDDYEKRNSGEASEDAERVQSSVESSNYSEVTETNIKNKSKKSGGTRFRRGIVRRKPAAMKN